MPVRTFHQEARPTRRPGDCLSDRRAFGMSARCLGQPVDDGPVDGWEAGGGRHDVWGEQAAVAGPEQRCGEQAALPGDAAVGGVVVLGAVGADAVDQFGGGAEGYCDAFAGERVDVPGGVAYQ